MMSQHSEFFSAAINNCPEEIEQLKLVHIFEYNKLIISDCMKFIDYKEYREEIEKVDPPINQAKYCTFI